MFEHLKQRFYSLPWYLRNIYFATLLFFFVWMLAFDRFTLFRHIRLSQQVHEMEEQKAFFREQITNVENDYRDLFSTDESRERFARERYMMKRPNEDLFVIVEGED